MWLPGPEEGSFVRFRLVALVAAAAVATLVPVEAAVSPPVLKWQRGGCTSFCQTGWYSSPAVADLDGDGQPDVIWGSYDVVSLNGATGALQWRGANAQRVWPGVAVADLTGDGTLEVIVGRGSDQVTVYDRLGAVLWTRNPFGGGEVRTLAVDDLESDGQQEVVVGRASGGDTQQVNVFEPNGTVRPGWPARHVGDPGYGWGMYNENLAVADLNGDGFKEIFAPTDTHYITALDRNGNQLGVNPVYTPRAVWSEVGVHVDQAADLQGYADCGVQHRPNFANSAPVIADVDGDGTKELVVIGDVYNCDIGDPDGDLYHLPFILKLDRTRFTGSGHDWTVIPAAVPGSGPLSQDYNVIQNSVQDAVVADLDGDGEKEILYSSYDGRVHAYWLDKTEHGNWPYRVPSTGVGGDTFRFAGEPVVADLDNDGHAEVIFTSWPKNGGNRVGHLHVLDYLGNELYRVALPAPFGSDWNGGLGAPTLANIDADADLEVVVGTTASGVVAYDLPNTANAKVQWGTGRGNFKRTGVPPVSVPLVSLQDASVTEGNTGLTSLKIPVTLSVSTSVPVSVHYATADATALAGSDYVATSGTLTFPPGSTAGEVAVTVNADRVLEPNETFVVNLTSPTNGVLADNQAVGTITNDDTAGLTIADVSVGEPPSGTRTAPFTVTLAPAAAGTVTVQYATANGTAVAPSDYVAVAGTLTFPANATTQTIPVTINADAIKESPETFTVTLSNAIGGPTIVVPTATGRIVDPGNLYTVAPCRLADTRGAQGPALTPGVDRVFTVSGLCGVPSTARAASVNVTVTAPTQAGDLRLYGAGSGLPFASAVNYGLGQTRANNAIVPLGTLGKIAVHLDQAAGSVHVILDVNGYVE
jgi:Calx-beta domain/FG-GAP-like repeat/FG-GAP repeat